MFVTVARQARGKGPIGVAVSVASREEGRKVRYIAVVLVATLAEPGCLIYYHGGGGCWSGRDMPAVGGEVGGLGCEPGVVLSSLCG